MNTDEFREMVRELKEKLGEGWVTDKADLDIDAKADTDRIYLHFSRGTSKPTGLLRDR